MAYQTGIAQNERDLLEKLNTFLTTDPTLVRDGQAWTVLHRNTVPATTQTIERVQYMWKSTGTGTDLDIYIGCETVNNIAEDVYNLNFWGGTLFNTDLVDGNNIRAGVINCSPVVTLHADARPVEYHFVASGRCFKVVTRISTVCSSAYLGFILPTVPPTEYPYPVCVAGSAPQLVNEKLPRHSIKDEEFSCFAAPRYRNCYLFTPDQTWRDFYAYCRYKTSTYAADGYYQMIYPYCNEQLNNSQGNFIFDVMRGVDRVPLESVEFLSVEGASQGVNRWGAYDGVYFIPGMQRATGDVVNINNTNTGIVFNNGFRTGLKDYFVLDIGEVG